MQSNKNKFLKPVALFGSVWCISLAICCVIMAWTEPGGTPPAGNVSAPLNTGLAMQTKSGGLNISGNVGIGTTNPSASLDVNGMIKATAIQAPGIVKQMLTAVVSNNIQTSSASYVDIPNLTITAQTGNSNLFVLWNAGVAVTGNATRCQIRMVIDGIPAGTYMGGGYGWSGNGQIAIDSMGGNTIAQVNPGTHTIKLQWRNAADIESGTSYIYPNTDNGYGGSLTVMEVSR